MDFSLQPHRKRMGESDTGANRNVTVLKARGPSTPRPVVQEGDSPVKPEQETTAKSFSELPHDILASILFKLPAIYLSSLRCVCKSWDSLIRNSSFVEQHFYNRANGEVPGIISLCVNFGSSKFDSSKYPKYFSLKFFEEDSRLSNRHEFDLSRILKGSYYSISNSCDGLICVFGLVNTYIMNPSIRRLRQLPRGSLHCELSGYRRTVDTVPMVGIGFDSSTRAYKVVRIFRRKYERKISVGEENMSMQGEVYTLGGSCSWKAIGKAPLSASTWSVSTLPVIVNGAIHWLNPGGPHNKRGKGGALSFNIKEETFGVILHPEGSPGTYLSSSLMEFKGCLCVCYQHMSEKQMDIWMLEDYNNHKWIKQYSINLTMMHKWSVYLGSQTRLLTIRNRQMVLCNIEGRMDYFDIEEEKFVKHEELVVDSQNNAPYIGSLIWPKERVAMPYIQQCTTYHNKDRS